MTSTRKLVLLSLLTTLALIVYIIELQIPPLVALPGMKLGLANMVSLATLLLFGAKEAMTVLLLRITLGSMITGQVSAFFFSLSGGVLSNIGMIILYKLFKDHVSIWAISIIGAILHSVGQLFIAAIVIQNSRIYFYLPLLLLTSIVTGYFVGLGANFIFRHFKKLSL